MILIALGSNLSGDFFHPADNVRFALNEMERNNIRIVQRSSLYVTRAFPNPEDPCFINAVVNIDTRLGPLDLLKFLQETEKKSGRERPYKNAPRTLDIDILDYKGMVKNFGNVLILPHPRMQMREFVMVPIAEIAPDWRHPVSDKTAQDYVQGYSNEKISSIKLYQENGDHADDTDISSNAYA